MLHISKVIFRFQLRFVKRINKSENDKRMLALCEHECKKKFKRCLASGWQTRNEKCELRRNCVG